MMIYRGSYEAGSVASIGYLENGIEDALESVSAEKLIAGVPFFTRLWFETPKTEEELAEQAGTEAASLSKQSDQFCLRYDGSGAGSGGCRCTDTVL